VAAQLAGLKPADRDALARLGVHLGRESIWLSGHGKAAAVMLKRLLWSAYHDRPLPFDAGEQPLSVAADPAVPETGYLALGYRTIGGRAVRLDALERLSKAAHLLARQGAFAPTETLAGLIGCTSEELAPVLQSLGFRRHVADEQVTFALRRRGAVPADLPATVNGHAPRRRRRRRPAKVAPGDTPFARLADLRFGK
jgi:ATP-dependent RNA helicase SUPV3L1/SUV3